VLCHAPFELISNSSYLFFEPLTSKYQRCHVLVCLGIVPHVGNSVLRGDVVIRAMMSVVTRHMHGRVSVYVGCIALNSCST